MIAPAGKYTAVRQAAARPAPAAPPRRPGVNLLIPKFRRLVEGDHEWFWRELRGGAWLNEYVRREKANNVQAMRRVARKYHGAQRNFRTEDLELLAEVPGRLYHRWRQTDPDFWRDPKNLKALRRDNEEAREFIFV